MRGFMLGASLSVAFIIGCVARPYIVPPANANQAAFQRWQYYCFNDGDPQRVQANANKAGLQGWEMAGQGNYNPGSSIWCFKRRM